MAITRKVFWLGMVPNDCQLTSRPIEDQFVDGRAPNGMWAIMHPDTFKELGQVPGTGFGQLYQRQSDGRWMKIAG